MNKTFAHILALLSALLVWASCSVREDLIIEMISSM